MKEHLSKTDIVNLIRTEKTFLKNEFGVVAIGLFGSYAKGEEKADSDIDLMVIGNVNLDRFDSLISRLEKKFGRTINYVAYDYKEFLDKRKRKDGFIRDVLRDKKIMLRGDENELQKA